MLFFNANIKDQGYWALSSNTSLEQYMPEYLSATDDGHTRVVCDLTNLIAFVD